MITRTVVIPASPDLADPPFEIHISPFIMKYTYPTTKWKITAEDAGAAEAILTFIINPTNFCACAGQKSDQLVASANKKYSLNLLLALFDFQSWHRGIDLEQANEFLAEGLRQSQVVEPSFKEGSGILWLLLLARIPPMPLRIANSMEFSAPYFFESGFPVIIHRNIVRG
jgi:hypothetical protein